MPDIACCVHPLLTVFNGLHQGGFKAGDKVAVIGLGGLGHLCVLYAKAMGGRVA